MNLYVPSYPYPVLFTYAYKLSTPHAASSAPPSHCWGVPQVCSRFLPRATGRASASGASWVRGTNGIRLVIQQHSITTFSYQVDLHLLIHSLSYHTHTFDSVTLTTHNSPQAQLVSKPALLPLVKKHLS